MDLVTRAFTAGVILAALSTGCTKKDVYPSALPWRNDRSFILDNPPPPELRYVALPPTPPPSLVPSEAEWGMWRTVEPPQKQCRGKGKLRRCVLVRPTSVDQANRRAVVKPLAVHTANGQSIQVIYPYDLLNHKVYDVHTSPAEFTNIVLPPEESLAFKVRLDPNAWEVLYGKTLEEGARQELVAVRPKEAGQRGRAMFFLKSGMPIYVQLLSFERPGMLSVTWHLPEPTTPALADVPLDQRPPVFQAANAYTGYTLTVEGKDKLSPPWLPQTIVDDGKNTLVRLPGSLDGQRMPVVSGIQQNGKPAIVQSRLYVRKDQPEDGAWVYVNGVWPALKLQDGAGLSVKIVRQVPPVPPVVSRKEALRGY